MRNRLILMALLFATIVLVPAAADDPPKGYGITGVIRAEPDADAGLQDIIANAISLQLARRGTTLTLVDPSDAAAATPEGSLGLAAGHNTQYLLLASYSTTLQSMTLAMDLYDVATSAKIGASSATGRIDLSLDAVVVEALAKSLNGIELEPSGGGAAGVTEGTATDAASTAQAGGAAPELLPAAEQPSPASRHRTGTYIDLETGAAAFLPTGATGSYLGTGVLATLAADVRLPTGIGTLGLGIIFGVGSIPAAGVVSEADILLVPMGADVRLTLNDGGFPGITLNLSGGPSFIIVTSDYTGTLSKIIPFLMTGMTLELPFTRFLGLSLEAAWTTFFESSSLVIMGFIPEITFYVRF